MTPAPKPSPPPRPRLSLEAAVRMKSLLAREREVLRRAGEFGNHPTALQIAASARGSIAEMLQLYPELAEVAK